MEHPTCQQDSHVLCRRVLGKAWEFLLPGVHIWDKTQVQVELGAAIVQCSKGDGHHPMTTYVVRDPIVADRAS